jgi:hypothetical protein
MYCKIKLRRKFFSIYITLNIRKIYTKLFQDEKPLNLDIYLKNNIEGIIQKKRLFRNPKKVLH